MRHLASNGKDEANKIENLLFRQTIWTAHSSMSNGKKQSKTNKNALTTGCHDSSNVQITATEMESALTNLKRSVHLRMNEYLWLGCTLFILRITYPTFNFFSALSAFCWISTLYQLNV